MNDQIKKLLRLVIEEVVESGEPVGSHYLVDKYQLDVSPATVRNWFAILDREDYLTQPHTSSGRMPTEKGYRFYLKELMQDHSLRQKEAYSLQKAVSLLNHSPQSMRNMADLMAELFGGAAFVARQNLGVFSTGISRLLAQPEFLEHNLVLYLAGVLDRFDEITEAIMMKQFEEPTPLIGSECPFGENCGSVLLTLSDGTLTGLLGPMRMDYSHGFALLRMVRDLIEN